MALIWLIEMSTITVQSGASFRSKHVPAHLRKRRTNGHFFRFEIFDAWESAVFHRDTEFREELAVALEQ